MVSRKGIIIVVKCHTSKAIQVINQGFDFLFASPSRFHNTFSYKCLGFILFHLISLWCCRGISPLTRFDEQNLVEGNKSHQPLSVWSETKEFTHWVWASENKVRMNHPCKNLSPSSSWGSHKLHLFKAVPRGQCKPCFITTGYKVVSNNESKYFPSELSPKHF